MRSDGHSRPSVTPNQCSPGLIVQFTSDWDKSSQGEGGVDHVVQGPIDTWESDYRSADSSRPNVLRIDTSCILGSHTHTVRDVVGFRSDSGSTYHTFQLEELTRVNQVPPQRSTAVATFTVQVCSVDIVYLDGIGYRAA